VGAALFSGCHVVENSSVVVEFLELYLESLRRLLGTGLVVLYPGHGSPMRDADDVLDRYLAHRLEREAQIIDAVAGGADTVGAIVERVYVGLDRTLYFAAAQNVGAHLRKLSDEERVLLPEGSAEWSSPVVTNEAGGAE
jgi:glyoxylase-like metal-dependent hydrolase (beta-lactamase superfamily II)